MSVELARYAVGITALHETDRRFTRYDDGYKFALEVPMDRVSDFFSRYSMHKISPDTCLSLKIDSSINPNAKIRVNSRPMYEGLSEVSITFPAVLSDADLEMLNSMEMYLEGK